MKKSLFTKILTVVGAAVLTLPAVLGVGSNKVNAAYTEDDTQHVILTKYGFDKKVDAEDRETDSQWTPDGDYKKLEGVEFEIYDVTANYWASPSKFLASDTTDADRKAGATQVDGSPFTTDANGQIAKDLPVLSKDAKGKTRTAVYLFHEINQRAGYDDNVADFWLTLPAKADKDNNVYVYPKNTVKPTYERNFVKKDANTGEVLPDAKFVIKNADGKFLQLTEKDGKTPVANKDGYYDVLGNNYRMNWVDEADPKNPTKATIFTSDKDGKFGLNGFANNTDKYTWLEIEAPDGYDEATNKDGFLADNTTSDILDTPKGLLPHTGGKGIVAFVVAGVALIALGGLAYSKRRAA